MKQAPSTSDRQKPSSSMPAAVTTPQPVTTTRLCTGLLPLERLDDDQEILERAHLGVLVLGNGDPQDLLDLEHDLEGAHRIDAHVVAQVCGQRKVRAGLGDLGHDGSQILLNHGSPLRVGFSYLARFSVTKAAIALMLRRLSAFISVGSSWILNVSSRKAISDSVENESRTPS